MRLESSLKWPHGILQWFEQNLLKKWRPNPPTTKVYKKSFSHILLSLSRRNQSSDFRKQWRLQPDFCHLSVPRSSDNSVTEMTHWRTCQWADPTDLIQRVLTQTWPSPKTAMKNNHGPRGQLDVYALSLSVLGANATPWQRLETPGSLCTSLAWKPRYCWLCNQLFIIKSNLM